MTAPALSVVVPVLNGDAVLPRCFAALEGSTLPRSEWELIVVDDGSTDMTAEYAATVADRVVSVVDGPRGPAFARNLGVESARGALLLFVDADVCVHPDTLERTRDLFAGDATIGAAFGAYDDEPAQPDFLSQYRNLYHRYVHLQGEGDAETFWAGCGSVRKNAFDEVGGYDAERYPRPQIEDIDLGYRLRAAGHRIVLDPAIEVVHLKRWTFRGIVKTDLFDRGLPWMKLLLTKGPDGESRTSSLNVGGTEKLKTALMGLFCALALCAMILRQPLVLAAALVPLLVIVALNLPVYAWFAGLRGWGFALRVIPMNLLFYLISGLAVAGALVLHVLPGRRDHPQTIVDSGSAGVAS